MDHVEFGTTAEYLRAIQAVHATRIPDNELALLQAHFAAPRHTATWAQLAKVVGYKNWKAVNLQYGKLAHRIGKKLGIRRPPHDFWLSILAGWAVDLDPKSGHVAFILRRPVIEALQRIGLLPFKSADQPSNAGPVSALMATRFWTCHWQFRSWRDYTNAEFQPVRSCGSNSFRKRGVSIGDTIYVVSLADGHLYLGGRMPVRRIASRREAVRLLRNDNLYDADEWVLDPEETGTPLNLQRRLAPSLTKRLRFMSKTGPKEPCFVSETELDNQATRGVRELTPESAIFLDRVIAFTDQLPRSGQVVTVTDELLAAGRPGIQDEFRLPDEVLGGAAYSEGSVRRIEVNRYERDPEARLACIGAHGTRCVICKFSFGLRYGPEVEGYIHVHHVRPLSEVGGEYIVDPVEDLRPMCPNCHAVLHHGGRCRSMEEVQQLLDQQKHAKSVAAPDHSVRKSSRSSSSPHSRISST